MEIVAVLISFISLVITSIFAHFEIKNNHKLNDINLEAEFMKHIYKDYLIIKIPEARRLISFPDNKFKGIKQLQEVLIELKNRSILYKYSDTKFYNELKLQCQELEDFVVSNEDKVCDMERQNEIYNYIETKINSIYSLINKKYKKGHV